MFTPDSLCFARARVSIENREKNNFKLSLEKKNKKIILIFIMHTNTRKVEH